MKQFLCFLCLHLVLHLAEARSKYACKIDEEVEAKAKESKHSLVVYLQNAAVCSCELERTGLSLKDAMWIKYPTEEILPGECIVFGVQTYAEPPHNVTGSVTYEWDGIRKLQVSWYRPDFTSSNIHAFIQTVNTKLDYTFYRVQHAILYIKVHTNIGKSTIHLLQDVPTDRSIDLE